MKSLSGEISPQNFSQTKSVSDINEISWQQKTHIKNCKTKQQAIQFPLGNSRACIFIKLTPHAPFCLKNQQEFVPSRCTVRSYVKEERKSYFIIQKKSHDYRHELLWRDIVLFWLLSLRHSQITLEVQHIKVNTSLIASDHNLNKVT